MKGIIKIILKKIEQKQNIRNSDKISNVDTLEAFAELENGNGYKFSGTTEQLFSELLEENELL